MTRCAPGKRVHDPCLLWACCRPGAPVSRPMRQVAHPRGRGKLLFPSNGHAPMSPLTHTHALANPLHAHTDTQPHTHITHTPSMHPLRLPSTNQNNTHSHSHAIQYTHHQHIPAHTPPQQQHFSKGAAVWSSDPCLRGSTQGRGVRNPHNTSGVAQRTPTRAPPPPPTPAPSARLPPLDV